MMTSSMETFSALLVNSPVTGEFPAQRLVTRSFDVFFNLRLNKRLGKQWWGWWFKTPSRPLWRHCNDVKSMLSMKQMMIGDLPFTQYVMISMAIDRLSLSWRHEMEPLSALKSFVIWVHKWPVVSPHKGPVPWALIFCLMLALKTVERHNAHCDGTIMWKEGPRRAQRRCVMISNTPCGRGIFFYLRGDNHNLLGY